MAMQAKTMFNTTLLGPVLFAMVAVTTMLTASAATCDGEGVPASILIENQCVLTNFSFFVNEKLDTGNNDNANYYDPMLHAKLIDCGCGTIRDHRSREQMAGAFEMFCKGKMYDMVFEKLVIALLKSPRGSLLFGSSRVRPISIDRNDSSSWSEETRRVVEDVLKHVSFVAPASCLFDSFVCGGVERADGPF